MNGRIVISYDDDEGLYGLPVWGEGLIGLRQLQHTRGAIYETFKIYKIN